MPGRPSRDPFLGIPAPDRRGVHGGTILEVGQEQGSPEKAGDERWRWRKFDDVFPAEERSKLRGDELGSSRGSTRVSAWMKKPQRSSMGGRRRAAPRKKTTDAGEKTKSGDTTAI